MNDKIMSAKLTKYMRIENITILELIMIILGRLAIARLSISSSSSFSVPNRVVMDSA